MRRTIVVGGCRQRDRVLRRACLRADSRQYLGTAEVRHVCVEQEHVVGGRVRVIERQRAIRGLADSVAEHIERLGKKTQAEWMVGDAKFVNPQWLDTLRRGRACAGERRR